MGFSGLSAIRVEFVETTLKAGIGDEDEGHTANNLF